MRHIRNGKGIIASSVIAVFALPSPPLPCAGLAILLLSGCAVGPDFEKPAAPEVSDYTAHPLPATAASPNTAGGEIQRFTKGSDISADWWTLFHSRPLNDLIEQSLANNSDLKAARAALSVARENTLAQRGAYYPALNAGFTATRSRQSAALSPTPADNSSQYDLFTPQLSISYVPDVFGLNRRTVESAESAGKRGAISDGRHL